MGSKRNPANRQSSTFVGFVLRELGGIRRHRQAMWWHYEDKDELRRLAVGTAVGLDLPTLRHNPLARKLLPFAHQTDRLEKLLSSIDLGDISVTAHIERVFYHLLGIVLAQKDDPRVRRNTAYPSCRFDAADPGQADVHKDQVRLELFGFLHRLLTVGGLTNYLQDGITGKERTDSSSDHGVILDNKHVSYRGLRH
jgi:hypothetical protein